MSKRSSMYATVILVIDVVSSDIDAWLETKYYFNKHYDISC